MRAALFIGLLVVPACSGGSQMPPTTSKQPKFTFTVEEVFYIKPPVDRVILVGTITGGSVRVGDSLVVQCQDGDVPVVVDGIERPGGDLQQAATGQQVGLKLAGIRRDQPKRGDQESATPHSRAPTLRPRSRHLIGRAGTFQQHVQQQRMPSNRFREHELDARVALR